MSVGGLVIGVRGIVGKELRSRTRGYWRPMLQLTIYLALVALGVVMVLASESTSTGTLSPKLGDTLFATLTVGSVLLITFLAPGLTAASISGERERLTLDLLLVTRTSAIGLVTGKLAGALLWIGYMVVASLPALAVVNLFGGVPLSKVAAALCIIAATALAYSALGVAASAIFRRTILATVLAYAVVLLTVIVIPIATVALLSALSISLGSIVAGAGRGPASAGLPPLWAWLTSSSPVSVLALILGDDSFGARPGGVGFGWGPTTTYVVTGQDRPVTSLAPWLLYSLLSVVFSLVCLLLAGIALRPMRPRRILRRGY